MAFDRNYDAKVRAAAFEWLSRRVSMHGEVLSRDLLARGFELDERRIPLVGPQGIFKPAVMEVPLSITTAPNGPYDDAFGYDNLLRYRYRGTDPQHRDNVGLRFAMQNNLPLAYFHGLVRGKYLAMWPVYVVRDQPEYLAFSIAVDDAKQLDIFSEAHQATGAVADIRRGYVTTTAVRRLHPSAFRERVLRAYRHQCAFCRLRHGELLDAAHIIPDAEPEGQPIVSNGLSLCRLHHATFDRFFVGVRPDGIIEVRSDILSEFDGPTLQHAIQGLHDQPIAVPRKPAERPSVDLLAERYDRFLEVAAAI
ncbi:MAG: HNH endonuclease [Deltaproteobacteria bacterium]|nr:HNH endonuclease [Deltaproteobacteria bacterium]